jgi:hypothetical protein
MIEEYDDEGIGAIMKIHPEWVQEENKGGSFVEAAVSHGYFEIVRLFVDGGIDCLAARALATKLGHYDMVWYMAGTDSDRLQFFFNAVDTGRIDQITSISCVARHWIRANALRYELMARAVIADQPAVVRAFCKIGLSVNARTEGGMTPLALAIHGGSSDIVNFLVDEHDETRLDATMEDGTTALAIAVACGDVPSARLLTHHGADPLWRNQHTGETLWHMVAESRRDAIPMMELLSTTTGTATIDVQDTVFYATPLYKAVAAKRSTEFIRCMLRYGADAKVFNSGPQQETALHLAAKNGDYLRAWALCLFELRDLIRTRDSDGRPPVFYCEPDSEIARLLSFD